MQDRRKLSNYTPVSDETVSNASPLSSYKTFPSRYIKSHVLGEGGFGVVHAAIRVSDGVPVAIKEILKKSVTKWRSIEGVCVPLEYCLLRQVSHIDGVVKVLDACQSDDYFFIIMERIEPSEDLYEFLKKRGSLPEDMAQSFFRQVVEIINECYLAGVLHRDIKDENIIVDLKNLKLKIIDFGSGSYVKDSIFHEFYGTKIYSPPEWIRDKKYGGMPLTMWTLGVLLYVMVTGRLPFQKPEQILKARIVFPPGMDISSECQQLIRRLLRSSPEDRLSMQELLSHQWFLSDADTDTDGIDINFAEGTDSQLYTSGNMGYIHDTHNAATYR